MARLSFSDESGQIIIILAVIISVLLAGLSLLYAQNIIAGSESAYSQLSSSANEIQNLKDMVDELKKIAEENSNPDAFKRYAEALNEQVKALYASHGSYADIEVYNVSLNSNGDIKTFNAKIVFSNPEVEYEEVKVVPV